MAGDGTIASGKDGVLEIAGIRQAPCLREWTLTGQPNFQEDVVTCMESNADKIAGGWQETVPTGRGWTAEIELYFQRTAAGAAPDLDATNVATKVAIDLRPALKGYKYTGDAYISGVENVGEVNGKILHRVSLIGNGALSRSTFGAPILYGSYGPISLLAGKDNITLDIDAGGVNVTNPDPISPLYNWQATNLPPGLAMDSASGTITGTLPDGLATYNVGVTVDNDSGTSNTFVFTIIVRAAVAMQTISGNSLVTISARNPIASVT